jgi:hypothetical protein
VTRPQYAVGLLALVALVLSSSDLTAQYPNQQEQYKAAAGQAILDAYSARDQASNAKFFAEYDRDQFYAANADYHETYDAVEAWCNANEQFVPPSVQAAHDAAKASAWQHANQGAQLMGQAGTGIGSDWYDGENELDHALSLYEAEQYGQSRDRALAAKSEFQGAKSKWNSASFEYSAAAVKIGEARQYLADWLDSVDD